MELNVYAVPAFLTLVLLSIETLFLAYALPETRGMVLTAKQSSPAPDEKTANGTANGKANGKTSGKANGSAQNGHSHKLSRSDDVKRRVGILKTLRRAHFLFLGLFSGVEFTLTFLTFDCELSLPFPYS